MISNVIAPKDGYPIMYRCNDCERHFIEKNIGVIFRTIVMKHKTILSKIFPATIRQTIPLPPIRKKIAQTEER